MHSPRKSHSAKVNLRMMVDGRPVGLSQVGPMHAIFEQATTISPQTEASIEVTIDDETLTRTVFLYEGASKDSRRVEFF